MSEHPAVEEQFDVAAPAWWTSRVEHVEGFFTQRVRRGQVRLLAESPGGRPVRAALYGEPEHHLRGTANFNSALGAGNSDAFYRRSERKRPVLMVLAGIHGAEMEGTVGALSLLHLMEDGRDLAGEPQPALLEKLNRLRLIVIPMANPDGRARVPYDACLGLPLSEMRRINQGTRRDGTLWSYPACKAAHPMDGDVGFLGGYYDDAGVNLMHDEFFDPMSNLTRPLFRLVREEAPDMLLNLHAHGPPAKVMTLRYVHRSVSHELAAWTVELYRRLAAAGLRHADPPDIPGDDAPSTTDESSRPPTFNLTTALYHAGVALPVTFECPHGLSTRPERYTCQDLLRIHHVLFESAADRLLSSNGG